MNARPLLENESFNGQVQLIDGWRLRENFFNSTKQKGLVSLAALPIVQYTK